MYDQTMKALPCEHPGSKIEVGCSIRETGRGLLRVKAEVEPMAYAHCTLGNSLCKLHLCRGSAPCDQRQLALPARETEC